MREEHRCPYLRTKKKSMQHNRSRDTSIEVALRKDLWHRGYRYRKNYKKLLRSSDIVLTKYKVVIFCDSEFFHGKDWEIKNLSYRKEQTLSFGSIK